MLDRTQKLITLDDLVNALANDEFLYYYQPKVLMLTGELCGAEALIRWKQPDGSLVAPAAFIPLAESTGFITEITLAMFQKLIIDVNIINDTKNSLTVSFNASAKDFHNDRLVEAIRHAIENKIVAAELLEVELTETAILNDQENVKQNLNKLQKLGISLAMDDYGTGFSSIDTLAKWPFSTIKLDQRMVSKLDSSDKEFTIVQASIQMAHQLELDIVAEGIESIMVYHILQNLGCTEAQGYWISHPLALADFLDLCRSNRHWPVEPIGLIHIAQIDHIQWRKAIIDGVSYLGLRKDNLSIRGAPELDPTKCRLGRWYYGPGKRFAGLKLYDNFEVFHNRLHQIGAELLDAAKSGSTKAELVALMRQLTEQSILLLGMLQEFETEILSKSEHYASSRFPKDDIDPG